MKIHQYTHASREFYDCHDKKKNLQTTQFSQAEEDLNTGSEPHALVEECLNRKNVWDTK